MPSEVLLRCEKASRYLLQEFTVASFLPPGPLAYGNLCRCQIACYRDQGNNENSYKLEKEIKNTYILPLGFFTGSAEDFSFCRT